MGRARLALKRTRWRYTKFTEAPAATKQFLPANGQLFLSPKQRKRKKRPLAVEEIIVLLAGHYDFLRQWFSFLHQRPRLHFRRSWRGQRVGVKERKTGVENVMASGRPNIGWKKREKKNPMALALFFFSPFFFLIHLVRACPKHLLPNRLVYLYFRFLPDRKKVNPALGSSCFAWRSLFFNF